MMKYNIIFLFSIMILFNQISSMDREKDSNAEMHPLSLRGVLHGRMPDIVSCYKSIHSEKLEIYERKPIDKEKLMKITRVSDSYIIELYHIKTEECRIDEKK